MMKFKISVMAVIWLMSVFLLSAQVQSQPCGCADKAELLNLLKETQMVIQEFKFQLDLITAQEKAEGQPVMYSGKGYDKLLETFKNALRSVQKKGLEGGKVTMDVGTCSIKETETGNFCVRQAKLIRYRVHQKVCQETLLLRNGKTGSYLERMSMKQIVQENITAFEAARDFTLQMLKSLPKNCRPNDWFGYVVYQIAVTTVSNKTVMPKNANSRPTAGIQVIEGGSGTQIEKYIYIGTVIVEDGKAASGRGYAARSLDDSLTVTGRVYCSPKKPDEHMVDTSGKKNFVEGTGDGKADFRLSFRPEKRKYFIHLGFFSVVASGQISDFQTSSGACPAPPTNRSFPVSNIRLGGTDYYKIEEELKGSPDYLEGSKIEKPPSGNTGSQGGNISVNRIEEIQVRWMLRRFSAK